MVNHPLIGAPIRRYGHRAVSFVLIGLGTMILYEAGTFKLLRV
jgi:cadmium resistance protein CadD (predicted permease)